MVGTGAAFEAVFACVVLVFDGGAAVGGGDGGYYQHVAAGGADWVGVSIGCENREVDWALQRSILDVL